MRPALLVGLLVIFGLTTRLQADASPKGKPAGGKAQAAQKERAGEVVINPAPNSPASSNPRWDVEGFGESGEDAEKAALAKACSAVWEHLDHQDPPVEWKPSEAYINHRLVKSRSKPEPRDFEEPVGRVLGMTMRIEITPQDWRDILKEDQKERVKERQSLTGKALLAIVVALTALAGYFRLDEATKGYYTGLLRLAALGLVGAVGAGLWWLS